MRTVALSVAACLLCALARAGEEKLLCSFEKEEVAKWGAKFKSESGTAYTTRRFNYYVDVGSGSTETATQGKWALVARIGDRYNFLRPGNRTHYYGMCRAGRVLRANRWFRRAFPADWSGYELLRLDFRTSGPAVRVRLELEDELIPDPVVRSFKVPGGKWVTLGVDLARAAKELRLDLGRMANIAVYVPERLDGKRNFTAYLDNIRLAKKDTKAKLEVIRDESPMKPEPHERGKLKDLGALEVSETGKAAGRIGKIEYAGKPCYPRMLVMDRCIGGFGEGGIILAPGSTVHLSLDAGKTWTGLDGKGKGTSLTRDCRVHRSTATVLGTDVFLAYCTTSCGGGGNRTMNKFTKAVRVKGRWVHGPETVIESGERHCVDRLSLVRAKSGRLWCAYSHTGRIISEVRARWSEDGGLTWLQAGGNARVAAHGGLPYLTAYEDEAACFWRRSQVGTLWSQVVPVKVKVKRVAENGEVTLSAGAGSGLRVWGSVLVRKDGKTAAVLTLSKVGPGTSVAVPDPGPAGKVKAGEEVLALTWSAPKLIRKGDVYPESVATDSEGKVYLAASYRGKGSKVLRLEGEKWVEDSPPGIKSRPRLVACGERMACAWLGGGKVMLSLKPAAGKWGPAKKIAEEQETFETLSAPQVAPGKFIPVAWSTRSRRFIKVVAVPAGK